MSMLLEQFDTIFETPESVTRLQELILDMAVKGKLVPQDLNDEPTIQLLKRIKIEKEILIRNKKIKKEKVIPSVIDEKKPHELPKGWEWVRLNDIVELDDNSIRRGPFGSAIKKDMFVPKDINTFKVYEQKNAIQKDCFIGEYYISQEKYDELKRFAVKPGDIIISCAGTIGETYLLPEEAPPGIINQALLKIRINNNVMLNRFFLLVFKALTQKKINETAKGSAMKNMTSVEYLKKEVLFGLPPLNEQQRILEKVNQLMKFCDELKKDLKKKQIQKDRLNLSALSSLEESLTYEELRESLKFILNNLSSLCTDIKHVQQIRKVILSLAVKGNLVPQDLKDKPANMLLEEIKKVKEQLIKDKKIKKAKALPPITEEEKTYELPKGWEWVRVGEIFDVGTGSTPLKGNNLYYESGQIPWITSSATGEDYITSARNYITDLAVQDCNLRVYPKGTLVIALYGQGKTRGQISELLIEATTNQACACLFNISGNYLIKNYVKVFFKKIYNEIRMLAVGGAQPNLNGLKIKNTLIPLPPLEEQKRILEKVHNLMNVCDELEEKIKNADEAKENLLQAVLYQALYKQDTELVEA